MQTLESPMSSHHSNKNICKTSRFLTLTHSLGHSLVKLATLAAIFAAFLLMSHVVAAHWTTIINVEIDEEGSRSGQSCYEQFQSATASSRLRALPAAAHFEREQMESSENLRPCWEQLRQVHDGCRCEGIRQIVTEKQGKFRGEGSHKVARSARHLPSNCGFGPRHWEIRAAWC